MRFFALFPVIVLAACGGGGDGSPVTQGTGSVPFRSGDSLSYARTSTPASPSTGAQTAYLFTRTVNEVRGDGSTRIILTQSNGVPWQDYSQDADLQELSWVSGSTSCTNTPKIDGPGATLTLGKAWDITYTRTCVTSTTSVSTTENTKGSVVGQEPITTNAGTFDTWKLVYVHTTRQATSVTVRNYTCWRDKALNRTVSCDWTSVTTANGSNVATAASSETQRLSSIQVASYGASRPSPERFAGEWRLDWSGSNSGRCTISVAASGAISGRCDPSVAPFVTSSLVGTVDANGTIRASISTGATITGNFSSPVSASGTWTNTGVSGTWTAGHL